MNYSLDANRILVPEIPVLHQDQEYDSRGFEVLREMQAKHFWYQGRHRFLLESVRRQVRHLKRPGSGLEAIDLGGGCGGWVVYLRNHWPGTFQELALADSSLRALELAGPVVGDSVDRYQVDLRRLGWRDRWDVAFLLDVLEHIPEDEEVLREIGGALRPGGLLFVTTPALRWLWSYNDDLAHHVRRYDRQGFARLADKTGLRLRDARYFMFLLSPLLWLSRLKHPDLANMTAEESYELARRRHRLPPAPINALLRLIFSLETPWGHWMPFPWGTSILGVFQKPT